MGYTIIAFMFMFVILPGSYSMSKEKERKCQNCSNCCNNNRYVCVSSDMKVEEITKGIITVAELSTGDIIRGVRGPNKTPGWCKVDAVYPRTTTKNFTTYNGFTSEHMVVDDDKVRPHGETGVEASSQLYTLATECDATVNAAGQIFTPISSTFCTGELTWSDYLVLISAIRRVTSRTGYFWYLHNAFHDNKAAAVPQWADILPDMCTEMLRCARDGECQKFEKIVENFVHEHLNEKYVMIVERVFPNIGGDVKKDESGTVSEVVRQNYETNVIFISTLVVILIVVALLAFFVFRVIKKRSTEKLNNITKSNLKYEKV